MGGILRTRSWQFVDRGAAFYHHSDGNVLALLEPVIFQSENRFRSALCGISTPVGALKSKLNPFACHRGLSLARGRISRRPQQVQSICIALSPMPRLWSFDHCTDALRVEGPAALVHIPGGFQPGADLAVA